MNELEIVVDLSNRNQTVTGMDLETEELTQSHEGSKENSKEGIQEVMKQDDGVEVHEESTQNVGNENLADSDGRRQSDAVCPELGDVSNSEKLCLQSQPGQEVTLKEGDVEHEGVPFERESIEIDRGKKWFEEGTKDEEMHNEGRQTDDKETNQAEEEVKLEEKDETSAEDEENHAEDGQTQTEREEKESEEEKEKDVKEKSAAEKESGRFVEIDDEQFEVIDDMDEEESDDDYNEITVASLVHENDEVNAQLASNLSGYQPDYSDCKTQDSEVTIHVSNYQVNEQLASDSSVHQPGDSTHKTQGSEVAVCVNSDQVNEELASDSASFAEPDNVTRKKTQDSDDHYNEVTMIDQLPANSSNYQSNYDAQYQAWLSTAVTSHASMDYGPAQVRISGEELVLVGIMCSYLQLCPSGATSGEIRDYLSRQFKERRKDVVERLLYSLPVLFKAEDASGNAKWKFCGFGNLAEAKGERKQ